MNVFLVEGGIMGSTKLNSLQLSCKFHLQLIIFAFINFIIITMLKQNLLYQ